MKTSERSLVWQVEESLRAFEIVMAEPSTVERGQKVAKILNALEMSKDMAKMFGLGLKSSKPITRPAS